MKCHDDEDEADDYYSRIMVVLVVVVVLLLMMTVVVAGFPLSSKPTFYVQKLGQKRSQLSLSSPLAKF